MSPETDPSQSPYHYNPTPLKSDGETSGVEKHSEVIRKEYAKHETSVKSVGWVQILAAILFTLGSLPSIFISAESATSTNDDLAGPFAATLILVIAGGVFYIGLQITRLRRWARIPSMIISGFGLLIFPLGTIINLVMLVTLFSKKTSFVLSDEYQVIRKETPHIKYQSPLALKILLGILIIVLIAVIIWSTS